MHLLFAIVIAVLASLCFYEPVEHYWDIAPYDLYWDIYKCFDEKCIRQKSYDCYLWCNNIREAGAKGQCQINCADAGDIQYQNLKLGYHDFNYLLPNFYNYSLLS